MGPRSTPPNPRTVTKLTANDLNTRNFRRGRRPLRNRIGGYALLTMLISVFLIPVSALLVVGDYFFAPDRAELRTHVIILLSATLLFVISSIVTYLALRRD